jgi:hypothetical protein
VANRYLYADSEPFPLSYPFLPTLERFVKAAAGALQALTALRALSRDVAERRAGAVRDIERLEGFIGEVLATVDGARGRSEAPLVGKYAEEVRTFIERSSQAARVAREQELEHKVEEKQKKIDAHRATIRERIGEFLLSGHFDVADSRFRIRLAEGRYRMWATVIVPPALEIGYQLATEQVPEWNEPRRLGAFVGEMELQVGMKKTWLSRDLTREVVRLDEYVLAAAVLDRNRAEVHLRRRVDGPGDALVLFLQRNEAGFGAVIDRPGEGNEPARFQAVPEDRPKLETLWQNLQDACSSTLDRKQTVDSVVMDGHDVFEDERILAFINAFIAQYAPVVGEIARRSPAASELSLKLEHDDGRREEIYLKKEQLASHLVGLDAEVVEQFARLEILPKHELRVG